MCSFRDSSAGGRPDLGKVAAAGPKKPVSKVVAGRRRRLLMATRQVCTPKPVFLSLHPEIQIFSTFEKISKSFLLFEQKTKIINKIRFGALAPQP